MYYIFILISTALFSLQFIFNQGYQRTNESSLDTAFTFSGFSHLVSFFIMLVLSKFSLEFSWFSFAAALIYSCVGILYSYCSIQAFKSANLSVYSTFAMLGGMLLPSLLGIIVYSEPFTLFKGISFLLIIISVIFSSEKSDSKKNGTKYYITIT